MRARLSSDSARESDESQGMLRLASFASATLLGGDAIVALALAMGARAQ
jgi:hypothetical protein